MSEPAKKKAKETHDDDEVDEENDEDADGNNDNENDTASEEDEKKRLLSIWDLVAKEMRSKVTRGETETLAFLSTQFPPDEYPAKGSSSAASAHCVFCHKTFDPRLPGICRTEHAWGDAERVQKWPPIFAYNCTRCDHSEQVEDDDAPGSDYCRDARCTEDIEDRLDQRWEDGDDDLDECDICLQKLEAVNGEDDEDEEEEAAPTEEMIAAMNKKNAEEVIVID